MKKILFIALLLCCLGWEGKAQTVAVKSNILYDATATVNLGVEVGFNQHWSLDISGNYNGWDIVSDKSWKHWMVQPEARYWLHEKFNGHYFGLHGIYIDYESVLFILNKINRLTLQTANLLISTVITTSDRPSSVLVLYI